jgi:ketosteroid isomerase-like protein
MDHFKRRTSMSEQNVMMVKSMYEAFGRADIAGVIAALDPQVEWLEAENFIYADGNPFIGPQSVLEGVFMRLGSEWEGFSVSPKEILDAGDTIISHGYYSGTYKKNGKSVRAQFAHMFTIRDGKVTKFQQYTDTAQFLRAVES